MGKLDMDAIETKIAEGERKERKRKLREKKEKLKKDGISFWSDFKKFITKGNVLDLAVAVVIANAFNAIVNGLVKYIITPFVTYFTSGVSIEEWKIVLKEEVLDEAGAVIEAEVAIQHGLWMQTILDFLIIAFSIFVAVRILRHAEKLLHAREAAKEAEAKAAAEAAAREAAEKEEKIKAAIAAREAEKEKLLADYDKSSEEQTQLLADIKELLKNK